MTDPMRAETIDNELTKHCAYSLPAVALTLGRQNWPVLKDTYETLAGDMHVSILMVTLLFLCKECWWCNNLFTNASIRDYILTYILMFHIM